MEKDTEEVENVIKVVVESKGVFSVRELRSARGIYSQSQLERLKNGLVTAKESTWR